MDLTASLDAPHPPSAVLPWVTDLACYPAWLEIVPRAEAVEPAADGAPAWLVDLRGRLGPLARSKRLRMVRTALDERAVRFERAELDGREHSAWVLDATVDPLEGGARLQVHLHYSGNLFESVLERVLRDEVERSRARLLACITDDAG